MKNDHLKILNELCIFTGNSDYSYAQMEALKNHLTIDNMRKAAAEHWKDDESKAQSKAFFRKGKVGDWKNHFGEEKLAEWNSWIQKNLEGTDIDMQFE